MKFCIDQEHEGIGQLPLEEFYANPRTLDGRLNICIACSKRRATEREYRFRAGRKAQGLTSVPTADERAEREIERDIEAEDKRQLRREQEDALLRETQGPQSEDRGVLGLHQTENEFTESSGLSKLLFGSTFLRMKSKNSTWKIGF